MRYALFALVLALGALIAPVAAHAANAHFEFVNGRGEPIQVEPVYPGCGPAGKTMVASGSSLSVNCSIEVHKQTGIQVRVPGGAGVICYPFVAMMDEYRIEISNVGANSCSISTVGRLNYRIHFPRAVWLTLEIKNARANTILSMMTEANCQPHGNSDLSAGGTISYRCFAEDMAGRQGITMQMRELNNTRDLICQGWWHENRTDVFHGNCSIENLGSNKYLFTIR